MENRQKNYEDAHYNLQVPVQVPSYGICLDWMNELPGSCAVTFDFWSRGNYTRRLLYNRNIGVQPILVSVASIGHMRWAYRRLSLTGLPIDFVYHGSLVPPQWVHHVQPIDVIHDSGWGYIAFPGTILRSPGARRWWLVIGYARLMPESVARWIFEEAQRPFLDGRIYVAPAELIGIDRTVPSQQLNALAEVANGATAAESLDPAMAILELDLPWIDGMTPSDFEKLLMDHQDEIREFQSSFRELVTGYHASIEDAETARSRVKSAVMDLTQSAHHAHLRSFVNKCKGHLSTFPVAMGVIAAAGAVYSGDPFAGAAVLVGAGKELRDLWVQSKIDVRAKSSNPNRLLWRLGVEKKAVFQSKAKPMDFVLPDMSLKRPKDSGAYHWLCPPSDGVRAAVLKE